MEAKCNFCSFFGGKPHCNNCKIFNKTNPRPVKEIDWSLDELVEYINTHEDISEQLQPGDHMNITLFTGEVVKMFLLDIDKDVLSDGSGKARATFGIFDMDGSYVMDNSSNNSCGWHDSKVRNVYLPRIKVLLPSILSSNIKPVVKITGRSGTDGVTTNDDLFILSEIEYTGDPSRSYEGEGERYEAFARLNIIKNDIHLRSPHRNNTTYFVTANDNARVSYNYPNNPKKIGFCFCI